MLKDYKPKESLSYRSEHTVRLRFLWGDATAEVITAMGGNTCGAEILSSYTDLETGFTAPKDNSINQKHCLFDEEDDCPYREVEGIHVFRPTGERFTLDLNEAKDSLVSVEIIGYLGDCDEETKDAYEGDAEAADEDKEDE